MALWQPSVSPKQMKLIKLCHPRPGKVKFVLVSGPRLATKSIGCYHTVVDHAWNVRNASISVISPTVTTGHDGGCWWLLTERIIPEWIAGDFGLEWITTPRQQGATKKLYCEIRNKFGGKSRIQLDSLQYEHEAEGRFKNKMHSMVYVSELSYYRRHETYKTFVETLRGPDWQEWDFLFLGDTNPAEEGEESWIWKEFYDFRVREDVDDNARLTQKQMALMEFTVYDNIFISQDRLNQQLAMYDFSEDLRARYRDGRWVKAVGNSVFFDVFKPNIHIRGEYDTPTNPDPEIILPEENCAELLTGWDIGEVNDAFVICEKIFIPNDQGKTVSFFKFLDEVVYIGSNLSTGEFVAECLDKIEFWEQQIGRPVLWRNWSDRSAFSRHHRDSKTYDHQLVWRLSEGKIVLQASGFQRPFDRNKRVILNKKILFENRISISRSRCPNLIDSYQGLRPGPGRRGVDIVSKYKHAWDAASYLLCGEAFDEVLNPREEIRTGRVMDGLVSVPL